jgi:D-glycero-D-manno-heptose 1,7-bisphosphate phosphatase
MSTDKIKVAFLDRDGVINKEINYLHKICDFKYTYNCIAGLKRLNEVGYEIIIVTNQAGIAKGYYTEFDYQVLTNWYLSDIEKSGVRILDVFHCPHHPEGIVKDLSYHCNCRKPSSGMILEACDKYNIDLDNSLMIGDKATDLESALNAGINNVFLVKSGHELSLVDVVNYSVFNDLYDFSKCV